ncbi:MAG: peptide ABC transporter substrate-binding protein [Chloroflexi bacterium]|nr:peptide ABC transporter substrate-binding protein [Chloroflexota bacterium]
MSNSQGNNRWLMGIVAILVVALCGAVCLGAAAVYMLTQSGGSTPSISGSGSSQSQGTRAPAPTRASAPSGKKVLRLPGGNGGGGDPPTLDPALAGDAESAVYVAEIFSGLVTLDQNLKVQPDIASKWEVSDDRMTYTFTLRKDVQFHDGRPVTAQDFKYSIERAANPATTSATADTYLGDIIGVKDKLNRKAADVKGVQVVDDYTVKITIDQPKSYFLAKMTFPAAYIVDKNNVERGGRTWTDKPNGTGPFKLQEYVRSQRLILVKNPNYYGDPKPQIEQVDFILGGGSFMTMYENGDLDSARVSITDIERVQDSSSPLNKELFVGPALSTQFIVMNTHKPPFDDAKVRQAFALAIDRQKVVEVVFQKMPLVANSILPPGMPGYTEPSDKPKYDPAQAKQLLSQSKYAGKVPEITWTTVGAGGSAAQDIQAMTAMLKDNLGVNISIQQTDWATFIGQLNDPSRNPYQIFDIGWIGDYADPENFMNVLFRTGSTQNWAAYSNSDVDKLLDQAGLEKDTSARFKLYAQAEQKILSDAPVIPLTYERQYWLTKAYVKGMVYPPMIIPRLKYVSVSN